MLFFSDPAPRTNDFAGRVIYLRVQMHRALSLLSASLNDLAAMLDSLQDAAGLIDFAASWLDNPLAEKPQIEMTREISADAKDVMDRAQRENLLREKIASAKKANAS